MTPSRRPIGREVCRVRDGLGRVGPRDAADAGEGEARAEPATRLLEADQGAPQRKDHHRPGDRRRVDGDERRRRARR